jgi:hypothetical protein
MYVGRSTWILRVDRRTPDYAPKISPLIGMPRYYGGSPTVPCVPMVSNMYSNAVRRRQVVEFAQQRRLDRDFAHNVARS